VAATAADLSSRHGVDPRVSFLAGLGHDVARDLPERTLLVEAERMGLPISAEARRLPVLLHAEVGAGLLVRAGVRHPLILDAIRHHVFGGPGLSQEAKAVYAADLLEPGRCFGVLLRKRAAVLESLDEVVLLVARELLLYAYQAGQHPDPATLAMVEELERRKETT
jgi:predicted HD superfamily hydrolase involved in NAD metabolism